MPTKFETRLILRDVIISSGIKLHVLSREKKFHHFDIHQIHVQFTENKYVLAILSATYNSRSQCSKKDNSHFSDPYFI